MTRPSTTLDAGFAERLRVAIDETGMKQQEFADTYGLKSRSVSRYVTGAQAPDASAMQKLGKALRGRFIWVLTGEEPTEVSERKVRELSPQMQEVVERAEHLPPEDRASLAALARVLEDRARSEKLVHDLVNHVVGMDEIFELARQGQHAPIPPGLRASVPVTLLAPVPQPI